MTVLTSTPSLSLIRTFPLVCLPFYRSARHYRLFNTHADTNATHRLTQTNSLSHADTHAPTSTSFIYQNFPIGTLSQVSTLHDEIAITIYISNTLATTIFPPLPCLFVVIPPLSPYSSPLLTRMFSSSLFPHLYVLIQLVIRVLFRWTRYIRRGHIISDLHSRR